MAGKHEIDMTTGSIPKKILQFAIPMLLSNILQIAFHAADTIIVGRFAGSTSMAAVGSNSSLVNLLTNLFVGFSVGCNVLCARYYGSKSQENLSDCLHTSLLLSLAMGLFVGAAGFFLSTPMLKIMKAAPDVLPLASLYLKIFFLGSPASMVYNFAAAILRAVGDTKRPMIYISVSGIVNIVLNLVFVVAFHMDVAGVAIATVASQYLSMALVLRCMIRTGGAARLHVKKLRFHGKHLKDIVRLGLPAGLNSTVFNFANVTIQSGINSLGSVTMAGNAAAQSVDGIIAAGMGAFYNAAAPFTSQNYGAKQYRRIPRVIFHCMWMSAATALILGCLSRVFGNQLLGLFVPADDPDRAQVLEAGLVRLTYIALPFFIGGLMDVACGALRGLGKSWTPFIVSLTGSCVTRIIWINTVFAANPKLDVLYLCYPLSWLLTFAIHMCMLLPGLHKLKKKDPAPLFTVIAE